MQPHLSDENARVPSPSLIALTSWQCSRSSSTSASGPPTSRRTASSALQDGDQGEERARMSTTGERGRHAWHEAQRFYKQNGYQLAWIDGTPSACRRGRSDRGASAPPIRTASSRATITSTNSTRRGAASLNAETAIDLRPPRRPTPICATPPISSLGTIDPEDLESRVASRRRARVYLAQRAAAGLDRNDIGQSLASLRRTRRSIVGLKHQLALGAAEAGRRGDRADRHEHGALALAARTISARATCSSTSRPSASTRSRTARACSSMKVVTGKKGSPTPVARRSDDDGRRSARTGTSRRTSSRRRSCRRSTKDPVVSRRRTTWRPTTRATIASVPGKGNSLGQVKFLVPESLTTSTCTTRRRSRCSSGSSATSATAACGSTSR